MGEILVEQVMSHTKALRLEADTPLREIVGLMNTFRTSVIPVTDRSGRVLGIVSEQELLAREGKADVWLEAAAGRTAPTASELMNTTDPVIGPEATVSQAAETMCDMRVIRLPVVDEDRMLLGMITWRDVLSVYLRGDELIEEAIMRAAGALKLEGGQFQAEVSEGIVTLSGTLEPGLARSLVEFTRSADGVVRVVDLITRLGTS